MSILRLRCKLEVRECISRRETVEEGVPSSGQSTWCYQSKKHVNYASMFQMTSVPNACSFNLVNVATSSMASSSFIGDYRLLLLQMLLK